jgi:hypothetical protein
VSELELRERGIVSRTRQLSEAARNRPQDVRAWLEYVDFQKEVGAGEGQLLLYDGFKPFRAWSIRGMIFGSDQCHNLWPFQTCGNDHEGVSPWG